MTAYVGALQQRAVIRRYLSALDRIGRLYGRQGQVDPRANIRLYLWFSRELGRAHAHAARLWAALRTGGMSPEAIVAFEARS